MEASSSSTVTVSQLIDAGVVTPENADALRALQTDSDDNTSSDDGNLAAAAAAAAAASTSTVDAARRRLSTLSLSSGGADIIDQGQL